MLAACTGLPPEAGGSPATAAPAIVAEPLVAALVVQTATDGAEADAFHHATREVVADLFRRAPATCLDDGDVRRYEMARSGRRVGELPSATTAPCLVVATLHGGAAGAARASLRVFDISDPGYLRAQGVDYWHGRPMLFEDSAALPEGRDRRGAVASALREIAARAAADPHLQGYLAFAVALDDQPDQEFGTGDAPRRRAILLRENASATAEGNDVAALFPLGGTPDAGDSAGDGQ
jgi:hypothetical protein